jgi:hypothetical protein
MAAFFNTSPSKVDAALAGLGIALLAATLAGVLDGR